jgi:hypothetical protein
MKIKRSIINITKKRKPNMINYIGKGTERGLLNIIKIGEKEIRNTRV